MATQDLERLVVQLSADVNRFEKSMKRAQGVANKQLGQIEKRAQKSAAAIGAALSKFGAAALGGLSLGGLVAGFREVASGVAEIGAEAQRAGLSNKAFQELKFAAEQSRVSVDALVDGMKELSLRTDEFIISGGKSGSAAEAFQRLGFTVDELKEKIRDPSALLTEIIGKVQSLDKAAQIRIFDELFGGTGGEQFVRFIEAGEDGLRRNIQAANDLGIVLNDEVIARAVEVDRQFNLIAATIGGNLKSAIVDAFSVLAQFIDSYRDVVNQSNLTIDNRVAELGSQRLDIENKILEAKERQAELNRAGMLNPLSQATTGVDLKAYEQQLRAIADEEKRLVDERNKRVQLQPATLPASAPSSSYSGGAAVPSSGGGGGKKSKGSDPYTNASAAIRERIAALQAETAAQATVNPLIDDYGFALAQAQAKQDLLSAAQKAGLAITPELARNIDQLSTAYAQASVDAQKLATSQDNMRQAAEDFRSTSKDMVSGFISDLRSGTSAAEALQNALNKVLDKVIDIALNSAFGGGGGAGFFGAIGSLLGFANGGYTGAGGKYQPAGIVHKGEYVMDKATVDKAGGPAAFDALRRGIKGYASGGYVGSAPTLPSMRRASKQQQVAVTVGVSADSNGNLMPFVQSVAQREVSTAAPKIVQAANAQVVPTMSKFQNNKAGAEWRV